jgi:hypothetical protein
LFAGKSSRYRTTIYIYIYHNNNSIKYDGTIPLPHPGGSKVFHTPAGARKPSDLTHRGTHNNEKKGKRRVQKPHLRRALGEYFEFEYLFLSFKKRKPVTV